MRFLIDDFKGWSTLEQIWLALAITVITCLSIYWGDTPIALASAISNVVCVVLVTKGKLSNYVWGFVGVVLYAYIAYINKIYGDAMLNAIYYAPMQIVGFIMWKRNMNEGTDTVSSNKMRPEYLAIMTLVLSVVIYFYSLLLVKLGGQVVILDACSTVLSVTAMILMAGRYREQWMVWIIVNIVSIMMWAQADTTNISALLMWIVFLVNSIIGLIQWTKNSKKQ